MSFNFGEIYFVHEFEKGEKSHSPFVKIGLVRDAEARKHPGRASRRRLREHQTGNPRVLNLVEKELVLTDAVDVVEAQLHRLFTPQRVSGEWFEFDQQSLAKAIAEAKRLSLDIEARMPLWAKVERLKVQVSNGKIKKPSDADRVNLETIALSKKQLAACRPLEALIRTALGEALARGEDVKGAAETLERKLPDRFDEKQFAADEPKLYESFLVSTSSFSGSFLPKVASVKFETLGEYFETEFARAKSLIEDAEATSETHKLLEPQLILTHLIAIAEWDEELANVELRISCGKYDGIEGIVAWKRENKIAQKFDKSAFIAKHPKIASKYIESGRVSTTTRVKKKNLNR